ncbi:MAG: G/U mismatch-specific DNA glycosylase [Syntrophobacteraceae bacterium]
MAIPFKPTKEQVLAARDGQIEDVIAPGLRLLFCGINPGLYTAAVGHHFGRPGNRFWPALHRAGFTPRLLSPFDEAELLDYGYGITNLVNRATARADEVAAEELVRGREILAGKVRRFKPCFIAVLGVVAYRMAFERPKASTGLQEEPLGSSRVWVLPNPSGINAHYLMDDLVRIFGELKSAVDGECPHNWRFPPES